MVVAIGMIRQDQAGSLYRSPVALHASGKESQALEIQIHIGILHAAEEPVFRFAQVAGVFGIVFKILVDRGAVGKGGIGS